ncbi:hypothetical protein FWF48_01360 [Candidatus Saccharibacteria bacterium]|nr:hypothetical protein [Candidatus Saccharibacteria bacterium]
MEQTIIIILLVILVQTTILVLKNNDKVWGRGKRQVFVDTSSLIDGRIVAVAQTGFIGDELVVPRSVIGELQLLADGHDSEKRSRARFGLDVINKLQELDNVKVTIFRDDVKTPEGVDNRLLALAIKHNGLILTNDFNLNKVAVTAGIGVLNINDLAQSLRSQFLPGEKLQIELVQPGEQSHQAVGYLPDGTMVVVEDAGKDIGQKVEVEFVRYLQTSAGKMMFAKKVGATNKPQPTATSPRPKNNRSKNGRKPNRKETDEEKLIRLANR